MPTLLSSGRTVVILFVSLLVTSAAEGQGPEVLQAKPGVVTLTPGNPRPVVIDLFGRDLLAITTARLMMDDGAPARGITVTVEPSRDPATRRLLLTAASEAPLGKGLRLELLTAGDGRPIVPPVQIAIGRGEAPAGVTVRRRAVDVLPPDRVAAERKEAPVRSAPRQRPVDILPPDPEPQVGPDLAMASCTFTPGNPTESDRIFLSVSWRNLGGANAVVNPGDAEWTATLTGPGGQNIGGGGVQTQTSYTLAPAAAKSGGLYVVERFGRPAGTYTGTATVDPNNRIAETDETNNAVPCSLTIGTGTTFPDLVITDLVVNPANPTTAAAFSLVVTVKNQGTARAQFLTQSTDSKVVVSGAPEAASHTLYNYASETLDPGQSKAFTLSATGIGAQPGTRTWSITADPGNAVRESDETNNTKTIAVTVSQASGPLPDLAMQSCTFNPPNPTMSNRVMLSVGWRNVGAGNAVVNVGDLEWSASLTGPGQAIGGGGVQTQGSFTLAPNATKGGGLFVVEANGRPSGTYTGTATVDPNNRIAETNEANNSVPCTLTIAP